jgi:4-hydroxybenzoate polyprenyltransferase
MSSPLKAKLANYALLMRLNKPIGILLLLWPTMMALWIAAQGHPPIDITVVFIVGVILMRSAGCVINDFADRHFDAFVERTRHRPLATKQMSSKEALGLFAALILLAALLLLKLNFFTFKLALIALLLAALYPFMKRFTHFPQLFLGAAYGWAIPMAFAAINNRLNKEAFLLFVANLFWVLAYDTQYAMVDKKDDLQINIKSTAIYFGDHDHIFVLGTSLLALIAFGLLGEMLHFGHYYFSCLFINLVLVLYQYFLIHNRNPKQCFRAFLNNNYFGAVLFLGVVLEYIL